MAKHSFFNKLFVILFSLGIVYLSLNSALFLIFAPLQASIFGVEISFAALDNPVIISLCLIMVGILFRWLDFKFKTASPVPHSYFVFIVFSVVFLLHLSSEVMTPYDSKHTILVTRSIITDGKVNLDKYRSFIKPNDHGIEFIDGHIYNFFPIGVSLLAIPIVLLYNDEMVKTTYINSSGEIERFIASFFVALSSVFIYLISFQLLKNKKYSVLLVFIYAFCTSAWSTASRALWQHGPAMLMLAFSLYLILLAKKKPFFIQYLSLPLIFSYIVRPTNSISVFFLTLYVCLNYRIYLFRYLLWGGMLAGGFIFFNYSIYHHPLPTYYLPSRVANTHHFFEALLGNLISPARGLFVFSPIFIFSLLGFISKIRNKTIEALDYFLVIIVVGHWIVISRFTHWWGGWSFGPRFFSDMIPYLIYLMVPTVRDIANLSKIKKVVAISIFCILMMLSFLLHYRGANYKETMGWNTSPSNVDLTPSRIWDWSDLQFLRGRQD